MDAEGLARTGIITGRWGSEDIVAAKPIRLIGAEAIAGAPAVKTKVSRLVDKATSGHVSTNRRSALCSVKRGRDYEKSLCRCR